MAYYERGERTPDATVLTAYRQKYGVDIDWVLIGDDKEILVEAKYARTTTPKIEKETFKEVGRMVLRLHNEEGLKLPPDALLDEQASAYNALLEKAEDPGDAEELLSLLPWLEARLRKSLKAATNEPGTGKRPA